MLIGVRLHSTGAYLLREILRLRLRERERLLEGERERLHWRRSRRMSKSPPASPARRPPSGEREADARRQPPLARGGDAGLADGAGSCGPSSAIVGGRNSVLPEPGPPRPLKRNRHSF